MFDDMITHMESYKKFSPIVTELLLRDIKVNVLLVFVSKSYFKVLKTIILNATHYFIMKIPKKRELQEIASNDSSDFDIKDFMKLYEDFTKESYSFLMIDIPLPSDNPLRFWKNLL